MKNQSYKYQKSNIYPNDLGIGFSKKRGEYTIFLDYFTQNIPISQLTRLAQDMTIFINQLPDGKMTKEIEVFSTDDGIDIRCCFTTSLSKEELEQELDRQIF